MTVHTRMISRLRVFLFSSDLWTIFQVFVGFESSLLFLSHWSSLTFVFVQKCSLSFDYGICRHLHLQLMFCLCTLWLAARKARFYEQKKGS